MYFKGKYSDCIVYNDNIEENEIKQLYGFLNCPIFSNATLRIMPDHHEGAGAMIGFTAHYPNGIKNVCPNVIGVDIGCGVTGVSFGKICIDLPKFDEMLKNRTVSGCRVRTKEMDISSAAIDVATNTGQVVSYVKRSLGTLGGGNHFIELGKDDSGNVWAFVHSGSRNFGLKIANFYQKIAKEQNPFGDLSWLNEDSTKEYLHDMSVAQEFARINRDILLNEISDILKDMGLNPAAHRLIESVHNYISDNTIRKGAISATLDKEVLIPWNMRDGVVIGKGKGNSEWNNSAPHGAGRKFSRRRAKETLSLDEFKSEMSGIYSSCVNIHTLDESPMAYKNYKEVQDCLADSVEILTTVKPIYNFKAIE